MRDVLLNVQAALVKLDSDILENGSKFQLTAVLHPSYIDSAENLLYYLGLRAIDIRSLQDQLHVLGLSSLASSESHIRRQLQEIIQRTGGNIPAENISKCDYAYGHKVIEERSVQLFGKEENGLPAIMVTMDKAYLKQKILIRNLLEKGMNVARINCAHDDEAIWQEIIKEIKDACIKTGLNCKIYMDLAGPKIRTRLSKKGSESKLEISEGEYLCICEEKRPGYFKKGKFISLSMKGIISQLKAGNTVHFDDGKLEAVVEETNSNEALLRIRRVFKKGIIGNDKGINFPDAILNISPVTDFDRKCLPFVLENADLVGCSFIENADAVGQMQEMLYSGKGNKKAPFLIFKIETPQGVWNLPQILLRGMQQENFGIMIARGDLAVEIGFERMSEIQEEILWICEAAHVPVIWATQVLENLNKKGLATRSEITDAYRSSGAECVMLNKGKYILDAVETLSGILKRGNSHHIKKRFILRKLRIAERFLNI